jgi:hypothetical protein
MNFSLLIKFSRRQTKLSAETVGLLTTGFGRPIEIS